MLFTVFRSGAPQRGRPVFRAVADLIRPRGPEELANEPSPVVTCCPSWSPEQPLCAVGWV